MHRVQQQPPLHVPARRLECCALKLRKLCEAMPRADGAAPAPRPSLAAAPAPKPGLRNDELKSLSPGTSTAAKRRTLAGGLLPKRRPAANAATAAVAATAGRSAAAAARLRAAGPGPVEVASTATAENAATAAGEDSAGTTDARCDGVDRTLAARIGGACDTKPDAVRGDSTYREDAPLTVLGGACDTKPDAVRGDSTYREDAPLTVLERGDSARGNGVPATRPREAVRAAGGASGCAAASRLCATDASALDEGETR
jgi:hypothetical protein